MRRFAILLLVPVALAVGGVGVIQGELRRPNEEPLIMTSQPNAAAGNGQADVSSPAITASAMNGAINPTVYPGRDLGAKINNAFAQGDGCAEIHIPAGKYSYSTTIRMFKACQSLLGAGSALTFAAVHR